MLARNLTRNLTYALLVGLLSVAASGIAYADPVTVEEVTMQDPEEGNSWWAPMVYFGTSDDAADHLQIEVIGGDQSIETPEGVAHFFNDGDSWGQAYNDGTLLIAEGDADSFFGMAIHFDGEYQDDDVEFIIEFYGDEDLLRSITWSWDADGGAFGRGRWTGTLNDGSQMGGFQSAPVPEPGTLLLFGLGAAGLVLRRRRARASR